MNTDNQPNTGQESNQPNTINDSCTDGTSGTYQTDESLERIRIYTDNNGDFAASSEVTVEATVIAYSGGFAADRALFFYAPNGLDPLWTHFGTLTPTKVGLNVLSAQYTLPAGAVQAVRVAFRYDNDDSSSSCVPGQWSDVDDLIFAVGPSGGETASGEPIAHEDQDYDNFFHL